MSSSDELAAGRLEQVVVHGLVDPPVLGDEPEVDGAERARAPARGCRSPPRPRARPPPRAVSPASTWPFGSDQSSRPRRSTPPDQGDPRRRPRCGRRPARRRRSPRPCAAPPRRGPRRRAPRVAARLREAVTGAFVDGSQPPRPPVGRAACRATGAPYPCLPCPLPSRLPPADRHGWTAGRPASPRGRAGRAVAACSASSASASRPAGHELAWSAARCATRCSAGWAHDLDFTTDARPEAGPRAGRGLGRRRLGRRHRVRHGRRAQGRLPSSRSRPTAPRPTTATSRKPEVTYGDTLEGDLVRRDFTVNAMAVRLPEHDVRRPARRAGATWRAGVLRTPAHAGGVVRRRPAADAAGRPVRRAARASASTRRCVAAMTAMADRIDDRVAPSGSATSWPSWCCAPDPRAGLALLVDTGLADARAARAAALRAGDRRAPPAQGRLRAHADRARAGDRRWRSRDGPGPRAAAAPRCCTTSASRRPAGSSPAAGSPSTTTRWSARS